MEKIKQYCGVDVSMDTIDVCFADGAGQLIHLELSNNKKGFRELLKSCPKDVHFVMESTGVYHLNLVFFLHSKAQVFSVENALKIKRYIQMHLDKNKTDKKDAKRIMEYGRDTHPAVYTMPDEMYFECRSINNAVHDLTKEITKISNRLHALKKSPFDSKEIEKSYRSILAKLRSEKKKLLEVLDLKLLEWHPEQLKQVRSITGLGQRAAAELIVYTKAFRGIEDYRQLISYAGLSPTEFSSGSSIYSRTRISKRGGKQLRNILYMCALNAKATNRHCRELYDRLVAKGKNKKQALIAVCNKLLKLVFGCIKNGTIYDPNYGRNLA